MQEKNTVLRGHDRAILDQYAGFQLNDQMQSIVRNGMDAAVRESKARFSLHAAGKGITRKKNLL